MPNVLTLTVENPDEILNAGLYGAGALMRLQSSATEAGSYADVSGTGSTPTIAIVTATRSYTGFDPNGTSSSWYRTRFENSGGTRLSDWSDVFQVGDETAGQLCSLYDVQQELGGTTTANDDETIIEKIRQVSRAIERYTERWLAPRPRSGTTTLTFPTRYGDELHIPRGIRSITTLGIGDGDQPETGGTYTTLSSNYYIAPVAAMREPYEPGYWVRLDSNASTWFSDATFGAQITGAFGYGQVPSDIQGVAVRAAVRRYIGKSGGGATVAVGPQGTEFLLPDMSAADRMTLDLYKQGRL